MGVESGVFPRDGAPLNYFSGASVPPTSPIPDDETTGEIADPRGIGREQRRLLERINAMRIAAMRGEAPDGKTDAEMARMLVYDTIETLTRAEIVLQHTIAAINELTEADQEANRLKLVELQIKDRELQLKERMEAREQERQDKLWGTLSARVDGVTGWVGTIATDQKVIGAIVGAIVLIITTLTVAWASGWSINTGASPAPQVIEVAPAGSMIPGSPEGVP